MAPSLDQIRDWIREIEAECMPEPVWIAEKHAFECGEVTAEVVALLKMVRAVESLHALPLLANEGLISDVGAITRVIIEWMDDVLFLLAQKGRALCGADLRVAHGLHNHSPKLTNPSFGPSEETAQPARPSRLP